MPIFRRSGDNAAAFARRFGVTAKALRVYEREGLLKPARSEKGWRHYGEKDEQALVTILALKGLGLPLARIRELVAMRNVNLSAVLAIHEHMLEQRADELKDMLTRVRTARVMAEAGQLGSGNSLETLAKDLAMTNFKTTPEINALIEKSYTAEDRAALAARNWSAEDQAKSSATWAALIADAERLRHGPANAPEAIALGRKWKAEVEKFTQGNAGLAKGAGNFYREGFAQASTARQMPFSPEIWAFMGEVMKHLG